MPNTAKLKKNITTSGVKSELRFVPIVSRDWVRDDPGLLGDRSYDRRWRTTNTDSSLAQVAAVRLPQLRDGTSAHPRENTEIS